MSHTLSVALDRKRYGVADVIDRGQLFEALHVNKQHAFRGLLNIDSLVQSQFPMLSQ